MELKMSLSKSLRKLLYNLDLKIVEAKSVISQTEAELNASLNQNTKSFLIAKLTREKYIAYLKELENVKEKTEKEISDIVNKYDRSHQEIWMEYFIKQKTFEEIASSTHYSVRQVKRIISKQKDDLEGFFDR